MGSGFFGAGVIPGGVVLGNLLAKGGQFGPIFQSTTAAPPVSGWTSRVSGDTNSLSFAGQSATSLLIGDFAIPGGIVRSTNHGTTWVLNANAGHAGVEAVSVFFGNGVYLLSCGAAWIQRSLDDGVTWATTLNPAFPANNQGAVAICFAVGKWVALGTAIGPANIAISTDNGDTWTQPSAFVNRGWLNDTLIYDGTQFIAMGLSQPASTQTVNTSPDGVNWTETLFVGNPISGGKIAFNGTVYILGDQSTAAVRIAATPAGLATAALTPVAFNPDTADTGVKAVGFGIQSGVPTFIALGDSGGVSASTNNGATWTPAELNANPPGVGLAVTFMGNTFIAAGTGGFISTLP